jgi:hypothetical protein
MCAQDTKPVVREKAKPENSGKPEFQQPNPAVVSISEPDREVLETMVGSLVATRLVELDEAIQTKKPIDLTLAPVPFEKIVDRNERVRVHQVRSGVQPTSRFDSLADINVGNPSHILISD